MWEKMNNEEIYILCMMFGNETEILGVFTDKKKLIQAYDRLVEEDNRCSENSITRWKSELELPIVYKIPLNSFIGRKEEWCAEETYIFLDWIEDYVVDIREVR